jgi:putative ABC transport system permease protein
VNLLIGATTIGVNLALLTLGVFISYRIYRTLDLTTDGSFGVGAAVAAALLVRHVHPLPATIVGTLAGVVAGGVTGILHTRFMVSVLLAGVLTSTAIYSVCLFVMGSGNLSLASAESVTTLAEGLGARLGMPSSLTLFGDTVSGGSVATLLAMALLTSAAALALAGFMGTRLGLAMRASGNNRQMATSVAIDVDVMTVLGLGLANGLIALAGSLFAQYQGFANVEMGIGAVVTGLANLMIGEALVGRRTIGRWIAGAVVGAVVFRLLVAAAVRVGLNPNALKLLTALFVLAVLVLPHLARRGSRKRTIQRAPNHA